MNVVRGKVFRKYIDNNLFVKWKVLNPACNYRELIEGMKRQCYRQVIFSTEILFEIIKNLLATDGILVRMEFNENVDEDNQQLIKGLVRDLKNLKINSKDFINDISWIIDKESIDILSIVVQHNKKNITLYSNGVFEGEDIEDFYDNILKKSIEGIL